MSAVFLKTYQRQALDALRAWLAAARIVGAGPAFDQTGKPGVRAPRPYQPLAGLEAIPYVCCACRPAAARRCSPPMR